MKKTYIIPSVEVTYVVAEQMIAASITNIGGGSGIELGEGEIPEEADVKGNPFGDSIFD